MTNPGHLRRLAVYVDEPEPGVYCWLIHEYKQETLQWVDLLEAEDAFNTWVEAYDAGTVALMRIVNDELRGPRLTG